MIPGFDASARNHQFQIHKNILIKQTCVPLFQARNKETQELTALKRIKMEPEEDFSVIQQEIIIVKSCKHPNIVAYYGSYIQDSELWICMEFCGGGSLQDVYHGQAPFPHTAHTQLSLFLHGHTAHSAVSILTHCTL
uniref:Protein kinase domain-containing protein n=1 Tax=Neogobius melanostomus TaxID=47308 RepID=A0A8C6WWV1_9GOBI